jgi:predicted transposase YbfD/YdcC
VIGQIACQGKGHELEGVRQLIEQLPLEGNLVVGDALQCQRDICARVVEGGGDYLVPVKKNQPALRRDIRRAFSPSEARREGEVAGALYGSAPC